MKSSPKQCTWFLNVFLLLLTLSISGCNAKNNITGTVTYRQRIMLPPDAVVTVQLQDISEPDTPALVVGEQTILEPGQIPIQFEVPYEYRDIDDAHTYALHARIENAAGKVLFINATPRPVLTQGYPAKDMEIVLTPVSTSMPSHPANLLGKPDGVDPFDNANNWSLSKTQCLESDIRDGKYAMRAKGIEGSACWDVSWAMVQDFYIEVTIEMPVNCHPKDQFGLFFRAPDANRGYLYGLNCEGEFSMSMWDGQNEMVIIKPERNRAIATGPGISNNIGILASADHYYLFANGQYVTQGKDTTFIEAGKLGFFARAAKAQGFTAHFDDLMIWLLDDAYYPPEAQQPDLPNVLIASPSAESPTVTAMVDANVRSGPGISYPIYGIIEAGTGGEMIGTSPDNRWWAIKVPNSISGTGIAWIAKDYSSFNEAQGNRIPTIEPPRLPPQAGIPAPAPGDPWLSVTEVASVRSGPGSQYPVYGVAPIGTKARVVGISEDHRWWVVKLASSSTSQGYGWIYKDFGEAQGINSTPTIEAPRVPENIIPTPPQTDDPTAVTSEAINVRGGPGNKYPNYGQIPIGAEMSIVGKSADGEYWVVKIPKAIAESEQGWVTARYCSAENTQQVPIVQPPSAP